MFKTNWISQTCTYWLWIRYHTMDLCFIREVLFYTVLDASYTYYSTWRFRPLYTKYILQNKCTARCCKMVPLLVNLLCWQAVTKKKIMKLVRTCRLLNFKKKLQVNWMRYYEVLIMQNTWRLLQPQFINILKYIIIQRIQRYIVVIIIKFWLATFWKHRNIKSTSNMNIELDNKPSFFNMAGIYMIIVPDDYLSLQLLWMSEMHYA